MFPPEELKVLGLDWTSTDILRDDDQDKETDNDVFEEKSHTLLSHSEETKPTDGDHGSITFGDIQASGRIHIHSQIPEPRQYNG